jgi:hypothetical protein
MEGNPMKKVTKAAVTVDYSQEQKTRIVQALRAACVAQAEFWDALGEVEREHEIAIDTDTFLVGILAGDCSTPPTFDDLSDDAVWDAFIAHTEVSL